MAERVLGASSSAWDEVYEIVRQIPAGKVMSYGQIAHLLSRPLTPRAVGWAMHVCPRDVPWHRVVSTAGACSADRVTGSPAGRQRALLEAEGVRFGSRDRVDMPVHAWAPRVRRAAMTGLASAPRRPASRGSAAS